MLHLRNITKIYDTGPEPVHALRGINIRFRPNEFVAILGPSGCGKTTLLNIVGGLDRYTAGDLAVNGTSTRNFTDGDWDAYRNHSVGFVFQAYNLIPHQTALANVELALTLTGVSKAERRRRAVDVLKRVGLGDQLDKRPNQMSGGQTQRVAIARALINDPDILLADEPTGALDSETSTQVLEILKEVAKDRLVIMVTHNAAFAESYATRIVQLQDGQITADSRPYDVDGTPTAPTEKARRPSMSFGTALSLSLNNLLTKKARTLITAFAGSIGIIGIGLILALSSGMQNYIRDVEEDMLASYPITIEREAMGRGPGSVTVSVRGPSSDDAAVADDAGSETGTVFVDTSFSDNVQRHNALIRTNDLAAFKEHLEANDDYVTPRVSAISYGYDVNFFVYTAADDEGTRTPGTTPRQVHPSTLLDEMGLSGLASMGGGSSMFSIPGLDTWTELVGNDDFLASQYELVAGHWPEDFNELVLIVDAKGELSEFALHALGLLEPGVIQPAGMPTSRSARPGTAVGTGDVSATAGAADGEGQRPRQSYGYDELLSLRYRLLLGTDFYAFDEGTDLWVDKSGDAAFLAAALDDATELTIAGILRPTDDSELTPSGGAIGYTPALTDHIITETSRAPIVQQQLADPAVNVFSGRPFGEAVRVGTDAPSFGVPGGANGFGQFSPGQLSPAQLSAEQRQRLANMSEEQLEALLGVFAAQRDGFDALGAVNATPVVPVDTYDEVLALLGVVQRASPASISLYTKDFQARTDLTDFIADYNATHRAAGDEDKIVSYTDFIRLVLSSVTSIINSISYVLIAFVAISLIVSSIMIGIISYISVMERTKEIGILRSIGASKRDVGRVFNAETIIIGFAAGVLGVGITALLCIPINMVIESVSGIEDVAGLPLVAAGVLVAISIGLTLVAGIIPARVAARQDPVTALRTE